MTIEDDEWVAEKFLRLKQSAEDRGLEFGLTLQSIKNLRRAKRCFYTGTPFGRQKAHQRTIDRVDNDKGYVVGNVVACTYEINQIKGAMTIGQLTAITRGVNKKL